MGVCLGKRNTARSLLRFKQHWLFTVGHSEHHVVAKGHHQWIYVGGAELKHLEKIADFCLVM